MGTVTGRMACDWTPAQSYDRNDVVRFALMGTHLMPAAVEIETGAIQQMWQVLTDRVNPSLVEMLLARPEVKREPETTKA